MKASIGRYAIKAELGRGASGMVYLGFDPNINRQVAIKVLVLGDNEDGLRRFRAEAGMTGTLSHENVVKVYEYGEDGGVPYLVMELLKGRTLQVMIASGGELGILEKVQIMSQVAEGLHHAHTKGVIHRDMKPGNIMVQSDGTAKIMDFGIARLLDKESTWRSRQSDFAGTIPYMAPEQFRGGDIDKSVDIFAYGVIYYELLSGRQPFAAKDPGSTMYNIATIEPPSLLDLVPDVPKALEDLVQRLMIKDPHQRIERMEDVLFDTMPILQELRRNRAAEVASTIEALIAAGDLQTAQKRIKQVLDLDPLHAQTRRWRQHIDAKKQQASQRERIEAQIRDAEAHFEARRFPDALACFEAALNAALNVDKSRSDIQARIDKTKETIKQVRECARLVAEVRWAMVHHQIVSAFETISHAVELDPGNQEAVQLASEIRQEIRQRRAADISSRAILESDRGEHAAALAILAGVESDLAGEPVIIQAREQIEAGLAAFRERQRAAEIQTKLEKIHALLAGCKFEDAEQGAVSLCAEYPESEEGPPLLDEVRERWAAERRAESIRTINQAARRLIEEKQFDAAIETLRAGLVSFPLERNMSRLLEMVETMHVARVRTKAIDTVVRRVQALRAQGELEQGLELIGSAFTEFGDASELLECRKNLEEELRQRNYAHRRDQVLVEAMVLVANMQVEEAIRLLNDAQSEFPGDSELLRTLRAAEDADKALRWVSGRWESLAAIARLEGSGQLEDALKEVDLALVDREGDTTLLDTRRRLRGKLQGREKDRILSERMREIEAAIASGDWDRAATCLTGAYIDFPEAEALNGYAPRIERARALASKGAGGGGNVEALDRSVQACFGRGDLNAAEQELKSRKPEWSGDPVWKNLWTELERRKSYEAGLAMASEACSRRDYGRAREILGWLIPQNFDDRARTMLNGIDTETRKGPADAKAIKAARQKAALLAQSGDMVGAIETLKQLAERFPGNKDIQKDLKAAGVDFEKGKRSRSAD